MRQLLQPQHTYRKPTAERPLQILMTFLNNNNNKAVIFRINTVTKTRRAPEKFTSLSSYLRVESAFHPNLNTILNS